MRILCVLFALFSLSAFAQRINQETMEHIIRHNIMHRQTEVVSQGSYEYLRDQLPAQLKASDISFNYYDTDVDMGGNFDRLLSYIFIPERAGLAGQLGNFDGNREFNLDMNELQSKVWIGDTEYKFTCDKVFTTEDFRVNGTSLYQVELRRCKFKNLTTGRSVNLSDRSETIYTFEAESDIADTNHAATNIVNRSRLEAMNTDTTATIIRRTNPNSPAAIIRD